VLVTSPGAGDGKTTVAANLAMVFGELGKRVVLVSCDLRRPGAHRLFEIPAAPGLAEVLEGEGQVQPARTSAANVRIVPSGDVHGVPGKLLGSGRMRQVIDQLRREADIVVLDTSPVLVSSDVAPLLNQADAIVVVARANSTKVEFAERTGEVLRQLETRVAGIALNRVKEISLPSSGRHYYQRSDRRERKKEPSDA
jgi:capsular exopolysaccharide synthesis family protein